MKLVIAIPLAVLAALVAAGCGKPTSSASRADDTTAAPARPGDAGAIVSSYINDLTAMGGLFKQVTDEASAQKHGPEIRAISARLSALAEQMKAMDPMQKGLAFAARAQDLMQIQQEMAPDLQRISRNRALAQHLGDAMKLPKVN